MIEIGQVNNNHLVMILLNSLNKVIIIQVHYSIDVYCYLIEMRLRRRFNLDSLHDSYATINFHARS
jgi:hypothetical protein